MSRLSVLMSLQAFLAGHSTFLPVAGIAVSGVATALVRMPPFRFRPFGISEAESLMNFSSLGMLRCICGADHGVARLVDRRQFCRACGCEVSPAQTHMLDKRLSKAEIRTMTRNLRTAAIRARNLEIPPSITSVDQLNHYLANAAPSSIPASPSAPTQVEQPQVH